jgi:F-type H+-transporting ATPase subunit a
MAYSQLDTFVRDLIGPTYKKYVPLIGTAFLYIFFMNAAGLIPGWMSPTSNINITAGLALVVEVYTQIEGIRVNGVVGYLKHFMGEPWWLFWLNFPIHVIGELAKLLSLTIRLFGNIFGEDVVIVILIALSPSIVPLPAPMYFFGIFTSLVQALVFSILTSVYIALMTVHDEGHGEHGHEDHGHGHGGHEHAHAH